MNQRELQRKLQLIRNVERGIKPDPAWVSRTRTTLLMQAANTLGSEPAPARVRVREFWQRFIPTQVFTYVRGPVLAVFSIVAIVAGGSIASVSAAEQSLPGDFLYPVKLAKEQTKLIFAKSKTDKLKIKTAFVERRVKEIQLIATTDVSEKSERIKAATETLRRDLDTVKNQLTEVSAKKEGQTAESVEQVVAAAKLVDRKSAEVVETLKDVKSSLSEDIQGSVTEVEAAAVVTGVKAVQVLIDSHNDPTAKAFLTSDELSQSIQDKVQGIQDQITSTAQKIVSVNTTVSTTQDLLTVSSTVMALDTAQQSLQEAKELLQQNKFDGVKDKLGDAAKAVSAAEAVADVAVSVSSSTPPMPPSVMTSSSFNMASSSMVLIPESVSTSSPKMLNTKKVAPGG